MMKRALVVIALAALLLAACGDDDDTLGSVDGDAASSGLSDDDQQAVERLEDALLEDSDDLAFDADDANCVAAQVVGDLGGARVDELDFEGEEPSFTPEEVTVLTDAFEGCLDLPVVLASTMVLDEDVSTESEACLAESVSDEDAYAFFEQVFANGELGDDLITVLDAAMSGCFTAEEYAAFGG